MEIYRKAKTVDEYIISATQFLVCKDWEHAYNAYRKAYELSQNLSHLNDAGGCAEKFNAKLAEECYKQSNNHLKLGQLYEKLCIYDQAIEQYEIVIHSAEEEIRHSTENAVARIMIQKGEFLTASIIYRGIATEKFHKPLGKWAGNDFVFRAVLCTMIVQKKGIPILEQYERLYPGWKGTACHESCQGIAKAITTGNKELFNQTVFHLRKNFTEELVTVLYELKKIIGK